MAEPIRLLTVLVVLMGGLLGLKTLSLVNGTSDWFAAQAATLQTVEDEATPEEPVGVPNDALPELASEPASCEPVSSSSEFAMRLESRGLTSEEQRVLRSLQGRSRLLEQRASELDTSEALIQAMEQRVEERIQALRELETQIDSLVGELSERESEDMEGIVAWYQGMEAADAAERMELLPPQSQLQIASRMSQRNFAPILAEMRPAAAADLTEWMASRSNLPQTASELEARVGQDG
jgi:flagellar motility protein MotE (MotC chaperone)